METSFEEVFDDVSGFDVFILFKKKNWLHYFFENVSKNMPTFIILMKVHVGCMAEPFNEICCNFWPKAATCTRLPTEQRIKTWLSNVLRAGRIRSTPAPQPRWPNTQIKV